MTNLSIDKKNKATEKRETIPFNPLHGGDLISASAHFDILIEQWIDLSTGINPEHYPVENIPLNSYCALPYISDAFLEAVSNYYTPYYLLGKSSNNYQQKNTKQYHFLAVAGTQTAIQVLPTLLPSFPILLPKIGYQEYRQQWQARALSTSDYPSMHYEDAQESIAQAITQQPRQHVLVINPNNPTGIAFSKEQLINWAQALDPQAYLIIDEAFIDSTPDNSVLTGTLPNDLPDDLPKNMIVLRSFGKFFGLAGIRLGFIFANDAILRQLEKAIGIWQVNGPAQAIAITALNDKKWQQQNRQAIEANARFTQQLCTNIQERCDHAVHSDLFSSYYYSRAQAEHINYQLALAGILTRVIIIGDQKAILRIGVISSKKIKKAQTISEYVKDTLDKLNFIEE
jgi:cobalamin biosynthetic protein CobC